MILSRSKVREAIENKEIIIDPFDEKKLNSNSYNLTLDPKLRVYTSGILDMRYNNPTMEILIPEDGYILLPGQLYLGCTIERTCTYKYIPIIEGRSSIARLGLAVHITAGLGEAGFDGKWTLELMCVKPLRIYPGVEICQIYFNEVNSIDEGLDLCNSTKYQGESQAISSKLFIELCGREKNVKY